MSLWGERSRLIVACLVAFALAFAGCGDTNKPGAGASGATPVETTVATGETGESGETAKSGKDEYGCEIVDEQPPVKKLNLRKPKEKLDPKKTYIARLVTNCGTLNIKLDVKRNPKTAASFAYLTKKKAYDNTWFHRIINSFMAQGGDPQGDGTGEAGYKIEEPPTGKYYLGTVAMAKGGAENPGVSSSQFFIVTGIQGVTLPKEYAIAGRLVNDEGMEVLLDRIASYGGFDEAGTPSGIAVIKSSKLIVK